MKISVIGTGYVGLVTGTCFAETGNDVICVDVDQEKLKKLRAGVVTIYEPGLETIFERNIQAKRLSFTDNLKEAVDHADIIFLALPTPPMEDGSADLQYVLKVAGDIAEIMTSYKVLVNKSTVPVGTADKVRALVASKTKIPFDVVSNPEFLREGNAVEDFLNPERVVVGTTSESAQKLMRELYTPYCDDEHPLFFMDERSSELTKYAANSFLATKISFMNEIAKLCEIVGADVDLIRQGIGSDSRVGHKFLYAGVGYGGSCFPKDVKALIHTSKEHQYNFQILKAVEDVNYDQKLHLVEMMDAFYGKNYAGKKFALWGLAFKPDTDDIREAPSLIIIQALLKRGAEIVAFDPVAIEAYQKYYPDLKITYAEDMNAALNGADALVVVTEWNDFRKADISVIKSSLKEPVVFDGRNIFDRNAFAEAGFYYQCIGKKPLDGRK